jgi:phenylalanyl-tRNA synthetase beta chain
MNIKITYNWLLEYLETDADPYEIGKYLSLSGPSVEHIIKMDDDYVFDIEITSNRIDMASVFGIAQEAQAILPQFGKKAKLKFNPLTKYTFENLNAEPVPTGKKLEIDLDRELCQRFTAIVFTNVQIKQSPELIRKRLEMVDIRSLNNVIDISNYLMVSLGQPAHMFDYDKIADHKMVLRESKKGEKLQTLDDREFEMPGGDIVIEDGSGKLIDMCGIMGGLNSSITNETTNVVFFVQTYNKRKIRKTSMTTGQRTMAATYFEKGLDPERVETALVYGVDLMNELTGGMVESELYDIYSDKVKEKHIIVKLEDIHRVMGIKLEGEKIIDILERLGFHVEKHEESLKVIIPSYRVDDVHIKEDIIEEIARVYGYYNLPNNIAPMVHISQPKEIEQRLEVMKKTKYFLKHIGLHETVNYSMISGETIGNLDLNPTDHLKLANTISTEIEYMRMSLIPSLLVNQKQNYGKKDTLKFFEIAHIYIPKANDLPTEEYKLGISLNTNFYDLKGIIEALFHELHIRSVVFEKGNYELFAPNEQAQLVDIKTKKVIGYFGKLRTTLQENMELKGAVYAAELDFSFIAENYKVVEPYIAPLQNAVVKLDANIKVNKGQTFTSMKETAYGESTLLVDVDFVNKYENTMTLRFYFSSKETNITEAEAQTELTKILQKVG